jgi:hypothetical protein
MGNLNNAIRMANLLTFDRPNRLDERNVRWQIMALDSELLRLFGRKSGD